MRSKELLSDNWYFVKNASSVFDAINKEGESVTIPHTWNAADGQGATEKYYRGTCWYIRELKIPKYMNCKQVYLEFQGVAMTAEVYLNGIKIGRHEGGYSTFRVNITPYISTSDNTLVVSVDNSINDMVYPQHADFTFYGGIYREVYLLAVNENHFDLDTFGGSGLHVTPILHGSYADISIFAYVSGSADKVVASISGVGEVDLNCSKKDGKEIWTGLISIKDVHRWDGLQDPFLYDIDAQLYKEGIVVDIVADRFGCREYRFDKNEGFFLNGRRYPLHGVSRHQDRKDVGNALTREMHDEDIALILDIGANAVRLAHYQHAQYFYDLCDEKGIIVWAEIPYITVHMPSGRNNTIQQMTELIIQNYNHPSIICWAMSNEITLQGITDDLISNHKTLNQLIHHLDATRASAMANLFMLDIDIPLVQLPDIMGYNLYYGWYVGELQDNERFLDEFHSKYPNTHIALTEYGADALLRLQSPKPEKGDFTESYQAIYHEYILNMLSSRPYLWGSFVWNMFEFAAAERHDAGEPGVNHKGLVTFDRKNKKDAYFIYKAWWSNDPFVHLCGRRYHDRVEPVTEIKVYSNQKTVQLYVDNDFFGEVTGEHIFIFLVPISSTHNIEVRSGSLCDRMEIAKVSCPNSNYFISPDKVRNWFDTAEYNIAEVNGYLSLNSTMAEIQSVPDGAVLLNRMMNAIQNNVAGGMGAGVQISESMSKIISRQSLKKLLQQAGVPLDSKIAENLNRELNKIRKID